MDMNYQYMLNNAPVIGFRSILSSLEQAWQDDYLKAPLVSIQLRSATTFSGIVTKFGIEERQEMIVLFSSSSNQINNRKDLDTCNYILFSEITGITIHQLNSNNLALKVVTQNKMLQGNEGEPLNRLEFLRSIKQSSDQISSNLEKAIETVVDGSFNSKEKNYAVLRNYMNNIVKAFGVIVSDTLGKKTVQEKVAGIVVMFGNEFAIRLVNNQLQFIFSESELNGCLYNEFDFKEKIEAVL